MDSGGRGMNPVTIIIITPQKDYCPSQGSNQPPVLKSGVLRASVVGCLTRNPGVQGLSHTGTPGFCHGSVLGQDTSEPQPSTGETQERHE